MITVDIERMPPPGLEQLALGDPVRLTLWDAAADAYLVHKQAVISMPIVTGPQSAAVIYKGVLLSFAFKGDPPIYSCIVPAR